VAKLNTQHCTFQATEGSWAALKLGAQMPHLLATKLDSLEGAGAHIKRFACTSLGAVPLDAHMDVASQALV